MTGHVRSAVAQQSTRSSTTQPTTCRNLFRVPVRRTVGNRPPRQGPVPHLSRSNYYVKPARINAVGLLFRVLFRVMYIMFYYIATRSLIPDYKYIDGRRERERERLVVLYICIYIDIAGYKFQRGSVEFHRTNEGLCNSFASRFDRFDHPAQWTLSSCYSWLSPSIDRSFLD